jgi:hypothetical protein
MNDFLFLLFSCVHGPLNNPDKLALLQLVEHLGRNAERVAEKCVRNGKGPSH